MLHNVKLFLLSLLMVFLPLTIWCATPQYDIPVIINPDTTITYQPTPKGDRISDFSTVGYNYGNSPLPNEPNGYQVPVLVTLEPKTGDQTDRIQSAIDYISSKPLNGNGFRGCLLLKAGQWDIHSVNKIAVKASGVVIRGEGDNPLTGTRIYAKGTTNENNTGNTLNSRLITFTGNSNWVDTAAKTLVDNVYIPSGVMTIPITGHNFSLNQKIQIRWPGTVAWQKASLYNTGATVDVDPAITYNRIITAITPDSITIDAPITSPLDPNYARGYIIPITRFNNITNVGISNCYFESIYAHDTDENHVWNAVLYSYVEDGFMHNCTSRYFAYSIAYVNTSTKKITINKSQCYDGISQLVGGRRYSFVSTGEQTLISNTLTRYGRHSYVINWPAAPGPNVFVDGSSLDCYNESGSHAKWNNGVLWDNISVLNHNPGLQVKLERPSAYCVAWNCILGSMTFENMPLHPNWSLGCEQPNGSAVSWVNSASTGSYSYASKHLGKGEQWSNGTPMSVRSLYEKQVEMKLSSTTNTYRYIKDMPVREIYKPIISSPSQIYALSGSVWSYNISAKNIVAATKSPAYTVTGLPSGVTVNATSGIISGTLPVVTSDTNYNLNISARNIDGTTSKTMTLTVKPSITTKIPLNMSLEVDMNLTTSIMVPPLTVAKTVPMVTASRLLAPMIVKKSYTSDMNGTAYTTSDVPVPVKANLSINGLMSPITITYNGSTTLPTAVGSYTVNATLNDPMYEASATGTLLITTGTSATVTLNIPTTPSIASPITATSNQSSLTPQIYYDGLTTIPTTPGFYAVKGIVADPTYFGSSLSLVSIGRSSATLSWENLNLTYNGVAQLPQVSTNPSGLPTLVSISGSGINVGSYSVTASITDPNVNFTPISGTMNIGKANASVTLTQSSKTYDGNPLGLPSITTNPSGLSTSLTWNGSSTAPSNVGSYTVLATINDGNYQGSNSITVSITDPIIIPVTVTLGNLISTYDGTSKSVSIITNPSASTTVTYNGSTTIPSQAGSYAVVATVNQSGYSGSASGTLVIQKASATLSVSNTTVSYTGNAQSPTIQITPSTVLYVATYNGVSAAPTAVGTYILNVAVTDNNYQSSPVNTSFIINKANASLTFTTSSLTYTGSPVASPSATTSPANLAVTWTWNGSSTPPANAGTYTVIGTVSSPSYQGSSSSTLIINKKPATITFSNTSKTYNGSQQAVTITTNPTGLSCTTTYNGSSILPTNAGNYPLVSTIQDTNYTGTKTGTFTITPASATVNVTPISKIFDGYPIITPTVNTVPTGLSYSMTWNGSNMVPSAIGSYTVVTTITNNNYTGSSSVICSINPVVLTPVTLTLSNTSVTYDGNPKSVIVTSTPSVATLVTYNGSSSLPINAGTYSVQVSVNQSGYTGSTSGTLTIEKATASAQITNKLFTYDGTQYNPLVTTIPSGLSYDISYTGLTSPPTSVGVYPFTMTINDSNYQLTPIQDKLTITKATATIAMTITGKTFDNKPLNNPSITTVPSGLSTQITWNNSTSIPYHAGIYTVKATINDVNYQGTKSENIEITKATGIITLDNTTQTYNGSPLSITAKTTPTGLTTIIHYNGLLNAPSDAGSYPITVSIHDQDYQGQINGTLVINKKLASVNFSDTSKIFDGLPLSMPVITTIPSGLSTLVTWNNLQTIPSSLGSYTVKAVINEPNYQGELSKISQITNTPNQTVTFTLQDLEKTYNGTQQFPTVTTNPGGINYLITYNGSTSIPSLSGTYDILVTANQSGYIGQSSSVMTIQPANVVIQPTFLESIYTGIEQSFSWTTNPPTISTSISITGTPLHPGAYPVVITSNDSNYSGSWSGTWNIQKAPATISATIIDRYENGNPLDLVITTDPPALSTTISWNTTDPSKPGSYTATISVNSDHYTGSTTAHGTIYPNSDVQIQVNNSQSIYTGSTLTLDVVTTPPGISYDITYDQNKIPKDAGNYPFTITITEQNYTGSYQGNLVIAPAQAEMSWVNLENPYDSSWIPTITTNPPGLTTSVIASTATQPGLYNVIGSMSENNYICDDITGVMFLTPQPTYLGLSGLKDGASSVIMIQSIGNPQLIESTSSLVSITGTSITVNPVTYGDFTIPLRITYDSTHVFETSLPIHVDSTIDAIAVRQNKNIVYGDNFDISYFDVTSKYPGTLVFTNLLPLHVGSTTIQSNFHYHDNSLPDLAVSIPVTIKKRPISIKIPDLTVLDTQNYPNFQVQIDNLAYQDKAELTINAISSNLPTGTYQVTGSLHWISGSESDYDTSILNGSLTINKDTSVPNQPIPGSSGATGGAGGGCGAGNGIALLFASLCIFMKSRKRSQNRKK